MQLKRRKMPPRETDDENPTLSQSRLDYFGRESSLQHKPIDIDLTGENGDAKELSSPPPPNRLALLIAPGKAIREKLKPITHWISLQ